MSARAGGAGAIAAMHSSAAAAGAAIRFNHAGSGAPGGSVAVPMSATSSNSNAGPMTYTLRVSHGGDSANESGCAAVTGPSQISVSLRHRHVGVPGPV